MVAIVTNVGRNKTLRARAGEITLPKIAGVAFGDGGVDDSGNVRTPLSSQTALNNELLRKEISDHEFISESQCRYTVTLSVHELAEVNISELALYDEDGDLIAIKNFLPKGKDSDIEMDFSIDDVF